ncbi:PSMD1 [Cordylochernes scorpioides]|uniref:26S proteasome non-ATPase regulatory subunit 1 n=1 Tax=Cordylochernes scorpioides TaxID=51811 RepID=A0ABY6JW60_9ARAC|nr:PSMD1 [Cordylochernes scorpioides]
MIIMVLERAHSIDMQKKLDPLVRSFNLCSYTHSSVSPLWDGAGGIIALLDETQPELHIYALKKLDKIVDQFWAEISEAIEKIEVLHEDPTFSHKNLAALVASKVYYHLGSFEDSLTYALGAGELFNVSQSSEYVDTIIGKLLTTFVQFLIPLTWMNVNKRVCVPAKCIDHYTKLRVANAESKTDQKPIDERLEAIVNRMFDRCFEAGQYKQAIGIALETRRMDVFKKAILSSDDVTGMLLYSSKVTMSLIQHRNFRDSVLRELVALYTNLETPDYVNMCQCLIFLDDSSSVAKILEKAIRGSEENCLMAYQLSFDLYESASQQFLAKVLKNLQATIAATPMDTDKQEEADTAMETDAAQPPPAPQTKVPQPINPSLVFYLSLHSVAFKVENGCFFHIGMESLYSPVAKSQNIITVLVQTEEEKEYHGRLEKLSTILGGEVTIGLHLQFLIRNNHADLVALRHTKEAVRNSVCHTATVISNALMHCGTTSDQFLRDNLDWLARATNWAKFTATASLGVIHKGHEKEALHLMSSYLPKDSGPGSGYTEGGGLYALGLIHANHGAAITDYLLGQLKEANNEVSSSMCYISDCIVRHGGCLGIGLAAMGTNRQDVYEQLKFNLYQDDAVTGEAAGIAMGLVMLGSRTPSVIEDMAAYAQETQHEKILRGLAVGIALTMYARLEEADALIESLCRDKDPLLRRSGMHTIAMAYCGTANNKAIRRLLHVAVSLSLFSPFKKKRVCLFFKNHITA